MKLSATQIASQLGLRIFPFTNKVSGKPDPKRTVIKASKDPVGNAQLGIFRKLTGLNPTTVKRSQTSIVAIFTSAPFLKKNVELPAVKLS